MHTTGPIHSRPGSHLRKPPQQPVPVEPERGADLGERRVLLAADALVVGDVGCDEEDVAALLLRPLEVA